MREIRVFTDQPLIIGQEVTLNSQVSRHLATVLRLNAGDAVTLFNGSGGEYLSTLTLSNHKSVIAHIESFNAIERESPLRIHLGIGLSRGDRMDWVIQKATEVGVAEITPLFTERTEVKLKADRQNKKYNHWQQIIISACEQCYRNQLPQLHSPRPLHDWLDDVQSEQKLVLHHRSDNGVDQIRPLLASSAALLIGPEGGLADKEINAAMANNFQTLTLGPRVLRTETAPVVAISVLQSLWGDFT